MTWPVAQPGTVVRFIGRCPARVRPRCPTVRALEVVADEMGLAVLPRDGRPGCPTHSGYDFETRGSCPLPLSWERVEGTVTEKKCGGSCRSARGSVCQCSCGGANHGADWLVQAERLFE